MKNHSSSTSKQSSILNCLTAASKIDQSKRMTSKEIAGLTGKRHDHVMRDIKSLISQKAINAPNFGEVDYKDAKGENRPMFSLDFHATMTLITGYNAKLRSAVIARWIELEEEVITTNPKPTTTTPYPARIFYFKPSRTEVKVIINTDGSPLFDPCDIFKAIGYRSHFTRYPWMTPHIEKMVEIADGNGGQGKLFLTKEGLDGVLRSSGHKNKFILWHWLEDDVYQRLNAPWRESHHEKRDRVKQNQPAQYLLTIGENSIPTITPLAEFPGMTMRWGSVQENISSQITGYFQVDQIPDQVKKRAMISR